jgi:hypothetical protein
MGLRPDALELFGELCGFERTWLLGFRELELELELLLRSAGRRSSAPSAASMSCSCDAVS